MGMCVRTSACVHGHVCVHLHVCARMGTYTCVLHVHGMSVHVPVYLRVCTRVHGRGHAREPCRGRGQATWRGGPAFSHLSVLQPS